MVVRIDVEAELLRWAVDRAGWDTKTIARREPRFESWVNGETRPTLRQLEKFAAATHAPFGQLFLSEPPHEDVPIPDLRTVSNSSVEHPSADLLDTIYSCQERQEWYRGYAETQGLPRVSFINSVSIRQSPTVVASRIREALDLPASGPLHAASWSEAFSTLSDGIEELGVLVMVNGVVGSNSHRKLNPDEFRGIALADEHAPVIFVNGADTKAAQVFTLIHELAHLWTGGSALSDAQLITDTSESISVQPDEELWCNRVAAEMLVPLEDLRSSYPGHISASTLDALAARYRVSTLVILGRIYEAGLLDWGNYRHQYRIEKKRILGILEGKKSTGGGNYYNTQPRRLSPRFATAVVNSTLEGTTSYRDGYRLLGTRKHSTFVALADRLGAA